MALFFLVDFYSLTSQSLNLLLPFPSILAYCFTFSSFSPLSPPTQQFIYWLVPLLNGLFYSSILQFYSNWILSRREAWRGGKLLGEKAGCALPFRQLFAVTLVCMRLHLPEVRHKNLIQSCYGRIWTPYWGQSSPCLIAPNCAVFIVLWCHSVEPIYLTLGINLCSVPSSLLIFHIKLGWLVCQQVPYFYSPCQQFPMIKGFRGGGCYLWLYLEGCDSVFTTSMCHD